MPNRKPSRNAYYFFVQEKIPELRRRGLPVARVADAIPYCSADWALLREEEKEKYAEMAREWKAAQGKDSGPSEKQKPVFTPLRRPGMLVPKQNVSPPDMSTLSLKGDQALLGGIFYFLNIFSHGELPPHCEQRFLPCEIGCVKYSLQEGIMADFHSFINPGEIPRGFRFHCQAASDSSHKIPISNFERGHNQATVLQNLYRFIHPNPGNWPPIYCKSDDRTRVNWCLKHMAKASEIRQDLQLLTVEDLVVGIYQQKFLKEPSKTWIRSLLDVAMWDYSSNTRCKWHEENDILFCALAVCKKIAYCISNSLATLFGIQLTEAHVPLQDYEASNSVTPKMVVLDAGRYQKLRVGSSGFSHFNSSNEEQRSNTPIGDYPSRAKISGQNSSVRGRGITRLLESISNSSSNIHKFSNCDTSLSPYMSQKDGYKSFSSLS
ncbi:MAEL isoform 4 [Pan troglodytes]|uniref:Protein maelstrom homolog n=3 Tax=Pan TaxID=9596 RepID=A0A6D2WBZ0_PANTR|nr:protein maelstrom homolog isoform X3 [Pan paniscus]PNI48285.1 MAEL isoform 1 [Pan troglodytes]PNI48287.1 MAEL isoform 4 [Pan troglodytes]